MYSYSNTGTFLTINCYRIWSVRFNPFHDQLILTASTDGRVLLSSAASVSSENIMENCLADDNNELEAKQM